MTKADIVERIYERARASKKDASEVVDLVFELIKACLWDPLESTCRHASLSIL